MPLAQGGLWGPGSFSVEVNIEVIHGRAVLPAQGTSGPRLVLGRGRRQDDLLMGVMLAQGTLWTAARSR